MCSTGSSKCAWNTMHGNNGSIKTSIRLWRLVVFNYVGKSFFLRLGAGKPCFSNLTAMGSPLPFLEAVKPFFSWAGKPSLCLGWEAFFMFGLGSPFCLFRLGSPFCLLRLGSLLYVWAGLGSLFCLFRLGSLLYCLDWEACFVCFSWEAFFIVWAGKPV